MTTSYADSRRVSATPSNRSRAFTLVEVMISAALGVGIMAAVMSSFLMIGRSGAVLYNYVGMEEQARRGLERFGQDTRMASALTWVTDAAGNVTSVTLTVPHVGTDTYTNAITYAYSSTAKTFTRTETDTSTTGVVMTPTSQVLMQNVDNLVFAGWQLGGTAGVAATDPRQVDQLQIRLTLRVQANQFGTVTQAVAAASNLVVSARYILRNKPIST